MVIPLLVLLAAGLCWLVALGVSQVRVVDAARETARALARDDDPQAAVALGRQVAPDGSRFEIEVDGETVRVTVSARVDGPAGLLTFPGFEARATAVAVREGGP